jgi:hypothetical protein
MAVQRVIPEVGSHPVLAIGIATIQRVAVTPVFV